MRQTIFLAFILIANIVLGQKAKQFDSLFQKFCTDSAFNGSVLIAENDKIIYEKSFGLRDMQSQKKINSKTIFQIASVSKQFTAMGIVLLNEANKLKYDDKVYKYIPELSMYKGITIRHLLNHTSGLFDYMQLMDSLVIDKEHIKDKIYTNQDIINAYSKYQPPLNFLPGDQMEYSNSGYLILATVIERISGKKYGNYLEDAIFKPLKMRNTIVYNPKINKGKIKNIAIGYLYSDSLKRFIQPDKMPISERSDIHDDLVYSFAGCYGDAYVYSSILDLYKWNFALRNNELISKSASAEVFAPGKLNNNESTQYGFGWNIFQQSPFDEKFNALTGKIAMHAGHIIGYRTFNECHIDSNKMIIILQNYDTEKTKFGIMRIYEILYNSTFSN